MYLVEVNYLYLVLFDFLQQNLIRCTVQDIFLLFFKSPLKTCTFLLQQWEYTESVPGALGNELHNIQQAEQGKNQAFRGENGAQRGGSPSSFLSKTPPCS